MEKTFHYQSYIFAMAKNLPRISFGLILLCWIPPVLLYLAVFREFYMPLVRLSIVGSLTITFAALFLAMILNELCNTTYVVTDNSLIKKSPYKVKIVHFDRVIRFRYVKIPLLKGFGALMVSGGAIRLPFIIDRLPECIETIKQRLDAQAKEDLYDPLNLHAFQTKALAHEESVRRVLGALATLSKISIGFAIEGAFVAQVFWNAPLRWALCWALTGLIFPCAGYIIAEAWLNRKTVRAIETLGRASLHNDDNDDAQLIDASNTYWTIGTVTVIVYIAAGIVFKNIITTMQ
jgi:hypothetical protein